MVVSRFFFHLKETDLKLIFYKSKSNFSVNENKVFPSLLQNQLKSCVFFFRDFIERMTLKIIEYFLIGFYFKDFRVEYTVLYFSYIKVHKLFAEQLN